MPQEFRALQCYTCKAFQAGLVTKSPKWACKLCGAKQSLQRVYAISSSAKDIRLHVQRLNEARLTTQAQHGQDTLEDAAEAQWEQQQQLSWSGEGVLNDSQQPADKLTNGVQLHAVDHCPINSPQQAGGWSTFLEQGAHKHSIGNTNDGTAGSGVTRWNEQQYGEEEAKDGEGDEENDDPRFVTVVQGRKERRRERAANGTNAQAQVAGGLRRKQWPQPHHEGYEPELSELSGYPMKRRSCPTTGNGVYSAGGGGGYGAQHQQQWLSRQDTGQGSRGDQPIGLLGVTGGAFSQHGADVVAATRVVGGVAKAVEGRQCQSWGQTHPQECTAPADTRCQPALASTAAALTTALPPTAGAAPSTWGGNGATSMGGAWGVGGVDSTHTASHRCVPPDGTACRGVGTSEAGAAAAATAVEAAAGGDMWSSYVACDGPAVGSGYKEELQDDWDDDGFVTAL